MLKIWGRRNSINVQKVLWTAELCGQRYESIEVGGPFGGTDTLTASGPTGSLGPKHNLRPAEAGSHSPFGR